MIKLSEARKYVVDMIGEENTPAHTTLRGWANKGIISGVVSGNTANALYRDIVVLEIIVIIDLKEKYKLKELKEFRNQIDINSGEGISPAQYLERLSNYADQLGEARKNIKEKLQGNTSAEKIEEIEGKLNKIRKIGKNIQILKDYLDSFDKARNLLAGKVEEGG